MRTMQGSFGKRVQTVAIWIFSFELENLNWVIWTKNLNCCLGQIILFENIIWIVVWVDVKCVMLSNKKSSEMSNQKILFRMDSNCWNLRGGRIWFWRVWMTFSHLDFIQKKITKRRFRLTKSFELPKMGSNLFAKHALA